MQNDEAIKAQRFYARLYEASGGEPITANNAELAAKFGVAYSYVVKYMQVLEHDGWITRQRAKHQPTTIRLMRSGFQVAPDVGKSNQQQAQIWKGGDASGTSGGLPHPDDSQSSKFKVQSSKFKVQSSKSEKQNDSVRTVLNNQICSSSNADLNFELLADFRKRCISLLSEFGINGRKRQVLCDHLVALVATSFSAERAEQVLADMRRAQESVEARQRVGIVKSVPGVMIAVLEDYAESGQMVLFETPPSSPATSGSTQRESVQNQADRAHAKGKSIRRQQATFTDEDRQQKEAEAKARLEAKRERETGMSGGG